MNVPIDIQSPIPILYIFIFFYIYIFISYKNIVKFKFVKMQVYIKIYTLKNFHYF